MSTPNKEEISQETVKICSKMAIFKQRYKEYSNRVKSLEEALTVGNLEISLAKNENARLKEELKAKQTSIAKYLKTLEELVQVEGRYCKLLQEKKDTDAELATEKKLRLDLEKRHEEEKKEINQSLQEELRILKEHSEMKEEVAIVEYSQAIEMQNEEIASLKKKLSETVTKYEEQLSIMRLDLKNAKKEIIDLRRDESNKETSITKAVKSPNKKVVEDKLKKRDELRDSSLQKEKVIKTTFAEHRAETKKTEAGSYKCLSISKLPPPPIAASNFYESDMTSPKKVLNPLEVFRLPSTSINKSPVRRKRKLYSRSDDTLW